MSYIGTRLSFAEIRNRIAASSLLPGSTRFGTSYDPDYLEVVRALNPMPQVWVVGQRHRAINDGSGLNYVYRQQMKVEIVIRALFQRYVDGNTNTDTTATLVQTAVGQQILGWTPTGANRPFVWSEARDGSVVDTIAGLDMIFVTEVDYQGP